MLVASGSSSHGDGRPPIKGILDLKDVQGTRHGGGCKGWENSFEDTQRPPWSRENVANDDRVEGRSLVGKRYQNKRDRFSDTRSINEPDCVAEYV